MNIINDSPFTFAYISGQIPFPGYSWTALIKGTFDLSPFAPAQVSEHQDFPTGDQFYADDGDMLGGPRYVSDFAYFKPRGDLLLVGTAYAPGGVEAAACQVTFQVGQQVKALQVFGDRSWKPGGFDFTAPQPFRSMELRYEKSYGGPGYQKNPIGKGYARKLQLSPKKGLQLPNILHPGEESYASSSALQPAGFGPLAAKWQERSSKLGSYRKSYVEERWPWFAADFDYAYFNAASPDMQVEGYLQGDESLFFANLHPDHASYHTQLPGLAPRCFINRSSSSGDTGFDEISLHLDTLWVDMDQEKLVLVWRGWSEVQDDEFQEIMHAYINYEQLQEPSKPVAHYAQLFHARLLESEEDIAEVADEEPAEKEKPELEEELAAAEEQMRAAMLKAGIDPDNLPPQSEEDREREKAILQELGFQVEDRDIKDFTREDVEHKIANQESFAGCDLSGLDLSALSFAGLDLSGAIMNGASLQASNFKGVNLQGAVLSGADLTGALLQEADLSEADFTEAALNKANLEGARLKESCFERASLQECVLRAVDGSEAVFIEADLSRSDLQQGNFCGADFSFSILEEATFQGARLQEASLEGARGRGINMQDTDLTELRASEGCNLSQGKFQKAKGRESIWEEAVLTGADFSYADLEGADFSNASLQASIFSFASLKGARFMKADLEKAVLRQANLFAGSFEKANLEAADLRGSNLYGVEFLKANLKRARLEEANLKSTKLLGV